MGLGMLPDQVAVEPSDSGKTKSASDELEQDRMGSVAIDQWRGLALILVLISHGFFFTNRVNGIGRVGVNLFFFISGILVFRSLSRSKGVTQWQNARRFWWRRFRRLYPALLTYIVAMLLGTWLLQGRANLPPRSDVFSYLKAIPAAIAYLINYISFSPMSLGHLWSVSCEMQFYLLAPLIYILGGTAPRRRAMIFGIFLALLTSSGVVQPFIGKWKYQFQFAVWPMMAGFCCENSRTWLKLAIPQRLVTPVLRGSVGLCAVILILTLFGYEMKLAVIGIGALLLAPCSLAYLFGRPMPPRIGGVMRWLGERTYSIYLWQEPFTICDYLPSLLRPVGAVGSDCLRCLSLAETDKKRQTSDRLPWNAPIGRSPCKRPIRLNTDLNRAGRLPSLPSTQDQNPPPDEIRPPGASCADVLHERGGMIENLFVQAPGQTKYLEVLQAWDGVPALNDVFHCVSGKQKRLTAER
jgi:peptidoglycan/LPS O-acetylase OafA/YrhL